MTNQAPDPNSLEEFYTEGSWRKLLKSATVDRLNASLWRWVAAVLVTGAVMGIVFSLIWSRADVLAAWSFIYMLAAVAMLALSSLGGLLLGLIPRKDLGYSDRVFFWIPVLMLVLSSLGVLFMVVSVIIV